MATYRKIKRKKGYVHKVIWRDSWGKQCSKTMPTYKEAKDLQDLLENGGTLNPSMRVNELFQQYYAVKENVEKLRVTSLSELEQTWRAHLQPEIGNAKVGDVRPLDLLRVLTRVKNKSARCQLRMVTLLKALFRFAQDNELTIGNPANKLKRPKYEPSAATILEKEEIVRLIDHAEEPWRTMIILGAFLGLRKGEVSGLQWQDVIFEADTIRIARQYRDGATSAPKSRAGRRVLFMPSQVKAA